MGQDAGQKGQMDRADDAQGPPPQDSFRAGPALFRSLRLNGDVLHVEVAAQQGEEDHHEGDDEGRAITEGRYGIGAQGRPDELTCRQGVLEQADVLVAILLRGAGGDQDEDDGGDPAEKALAEPQEKNQGKAPREAHEQKDDAVEEGPGLVEGFGADARG